MVRFVLRRALRPSRSCACGVQGVQAPWWGFGGEAPNSMLLGCADRHSFFLRGPHFVFFLERGADFFRARVLLFFKEQPFKSFSASKKPLQSMR
jgi:hypothetical protein